MGDTGDSALEITCPKCGAIERDDFEVIEPHRLTRMTCWRCQGRFALWLDECQFCGAELVTTWAGDDSLRASGRPAACPACHAEDAFSETGPTDSATLA